MSWWVRHWVLDFNEDWWFMVTTTISCWKGVHTYLFGWHTLWQLGKYFNKQYTQQNTIHQNIIHISSNINKQANNYIMQNHAKQGYIFGHLSLIWSLALNISSGVATVRDRGNFWCSQKRDLGAFSRHLSFWVSGVELPLIFYIKK